MFTRIAAFSLFILATALSLAPAQAQERKVMLVLDASNSMWGQIEGQNKIVIARDVVRDVLGDISGDIRLGVIAYGHRAEGDCNDIETVIPVGPVDGNRYMSVIDSLKPKGKTPLTEAVRRAAEELKYDDVPATVILVSDGIETCNADPCALAAELASSGVDFTVHVVGFDLSAEDAASFSCLAEQTGGRVFQARNAGELTEALDTAVQEVAAAEPESTPEPEPQPDPEQTGPNLTLSAVPAEGAEVMTAGPYWVIYEAKADANGKRREVKRSGSAFATLDLPPGKYWVEVSHKSARQAREIEIPETGVAEEVFVLGAGRLTAIALPEEGAEPFDQAYWILYETAKDLNGKRKEVARSGSATGEFFVPAGTYWLEGSYKTAKGGMEVSVDAGQLTEARLVLGAGVLVVKATATEGGEPLDHTIFVVYEAQKDLSGKRKEVARSARDISEFGLPAGKYVVVAQSGKAEASTEVEVAANQRTERTITLNLGALKMSTTVAGLSGPLPDVPVRYEIETGNKDLSGKRKQVAVTTRSDRALRLPAGDYHVVARLGGQNVIAEQDVSVPAGQLAELAVQQEAGFVTLAIEGETAARPRIEVYTASGDRVATTVRNEVEYTLAPGEYEVRLIVDDKTAAQTFVVASGESKRIGIATP